MSRPASSAPPAKITGTSDARQAQFLLGVTIMQSRPSRFRTGFFAVLGLVCVTSAVAQPAPSAPDISRPPAWTVAAGVESLWWRDVARMGPPVVASPVSWEGQGPALYASYDRGRRSRLHHFEATFASAGRFELRSPVRIAAPPGDDGAWHIGGKYEYRRYFWRDLWMNGFDAGLAVEGLGEHLSFTRHFDPVFELHTGLTQLGGTGVLAARLERWSRWSVAVAWGNGITIGRSTARHRGESETALSTWGGGWLTNLEIRGDVRVASQTRVFAAWLSSGEGRIGTHDTFTFGRSRFTAGAIYGR